MFTGQTVPRQKYMKIGAGQYVHRTNGSKTEIYEDWCRTICSQDKRFQDGNI
jgi:hypothetical protein